MSRNWLFLISIVAVIWLAQGLKHLPLFQRADTAAIQKIDWRNADVRPYQRHGLEDDPEDTISRNSIRLAKVEKFTSDEIGVKKNANPAVAKATTKDKKKKKKKKKFARKLPPPNPLSNQPAAASPKDGGRNRSGDGLDYVAGGAPAIPEPELNDENKAFEEWRNLLMARPDVVLMDRFIREFQSNLVSANVFYAILDLMIQDKNPKFHELAVRGAGAVTTLQSFDFLVSAIHSLPSGSIAANHAQNELYEYDSPMAIPVIHTILTARAGSADVVLLAVQSLDRSTQNYLERAPATPPNTPPNTNSNLILYRGLLPTLENILNQYAGQREIAEPARRAVDRIRARFGQSLADLTNPAVVPGF